MALSALNFYREAVSANSPEIRAGVSERFRNEDPFNAGELHQMATPEDSKLKTSVLIGADPSSGTNEIVSFPGPGTLKSVARY